MFNIVGLNCQKCNQCHKCQVSGHKSLGSENLLKIWRKKTVKNLKIFRKSENLSEIWNFIKNLIFLQKSENLSKIVIKNLKGHMSLGVLYDSVLQQWLSVTYPVSYLLTQWQGNLLSCLRTAKNINFRHISGLGHFHLSKHAWRKRQA